MDDGVDAFQTCGVDVLCLRIPVDLVQCAGLLSHDWQNCVATGPEKCNELVSDKSGRSGDCNPKGSRRHGTMMSREVISSARVSKPEEIVKGPPDSGVGYQRADRAKRQGVINAILEQ
jgi:hypothetical protein